MSERVALTERRSVYPTDEVPHLWAAGLPKGRHIRNSGGRLYAIGPVIYSFGSHFPMAARMVVKGKVVFVTTTRSYSSMTSKHQRGVWQAIPKDSINISMPPSLQTQWQGVSGTVYLWDALEARDSKPLVVYYREMIERAGAAATKKYIRLATRQMHLDRIAQLMAEWKQVHEVFGLRCSVDKVEAPSDLDSVRDLLARESVKLERDQKVAAARRLKREQEREAELQRRHLIAEKRVLPKWRKGDSFGTVRWGGVTIRDLHYPALRFIDDGKRIETSLGARVEAKDARRLVERLVKSSAIAIDPEFRLGVYSGLRITAMGIVIGCHDIPWSEVQAFCRYAKWPVPTPKGKEEAA